MYEYWTWNKDSNGRWRASSQHHTYEFDSEWGAETFCKIFNSAPKGLISASPYELTFTNCSFASGGSTRFFFRDIPWSVALIHVLTGYNDLIELYDNEGRIQRVVEVRRKVKHFIQCLLWGTGNK